MKMIMMRRYLFPSKRRLRGFGTSPFSFKIWRVRLSCPPPLIGQIDQFLAGLLGRIFPDRFQHLLIGYQVT